MTLPAVNLRFSVTLLLNPNYHVQDLVKVIDPPKFLYTDEATR